MENAIPHNNGTEKDITIEPSPIGSGAFGKVYKGIINGTDKQIAIKTVFQDRRYKNREGSIMKELNHPNIIRLLSYYYTSGKSEDELFLNCIMEYMPVTLSDLLIKNKKSNTQFPLLVIKVFSYQMLKSIGYLHSIGICHRDIKPQNIMLNLDEYTLKLCDFGCAKHGVKGEPNIAYICSRYYRPPELVIGATEYTPQVDVWSMGCVIAELVTCRPLFPGKSAKDQLLEIIKVIGTPTLEQIKKMNPKGRINGKIQMIPHKDWKIVLKDKIHDEQFIDGVDKLLVYEPDKRLNPFEAMCHPFFDELHEKGKLGPNGAELPKDLFEFSETEMKFSPECVKTRLEKNTTMNAVKV